MANLVFAENFRGYRDLEIDLDRSLFLVGDNSTGKTSILHLVDFVTSSSLDHTPRLDHSMGLSPNDFFSPYFKYADVTIGRYWPDKDSDEGTWKVITLTRLKGVGPYVKSCTYSRSGLSLTVNAAEDGANVRLARSSTPINSKNDLLKLHRSRKNMTYAKLRPQHSISLNNPVTGHLCARLTHQELSEDENLFRALFGRIPTSSRHLGPLRGKAERYYQPDRQYLASGLHFAPMYMDVDGPDATELKGAIDNFGTQSKLFEHLDVRPISKALQDSPLLVTVTRNGKSFLINQVGVGVSQVAPILVEVTYSIANETNDVLLIQQPELHLHPVAQAALGEFLYTSNKNGAHTICETHSDYMIDRYRSKVRDTKTESKADIVYCHSDEHGNHAHRIKIANDGQLVDAPDTYYEFFINELARTSF